MRAANASIPLLGRSADLARLREALATTSAGGGRAILVAGEPGIGKTWLVEELAGEARTREVAVLWGRCVADAGAPAYWPWTQIVRAAILADATRATRAEPFGSAALADQSRRAMTQPPPNLRSPLPETPPNPTTEPAPNRFRQCEDVCAFIRAVARAGPLVVIIEDIQWADAPSLFLLQFAARELADAPLLVLATCRDAEARHNQPLARALAEMSRLPGFDRITLAGLGEQDIARIITAMTGVTPLAPLVADIYQRTEGNPFFVTEIVRSMPVEVWTEPSRNAVSGQTIPPSVLDVARGRLDGLSVACRNALTAASVIGREFGLASLESMLSGLGSSPSGEELLDILEEAEQARVIDGVASTPGRFSFVHELFREALYVAVPASRRARLHRRAGTALEARYGEGSVVHVEELAHHFFQAAPGGDVEKAVAYAMLAARRAVEQLDNEAGAERYDMALRALDLLPAPTNERRYELLMLRGGAELRAGRLDAAQETFLNAATLVRSDHARERSAMSAERLARAALGMQLTALTHGIVDIERVELLEEALLALGDGDGRLRARLLARLAMELYYSGERERSEAHSQNAVRIARDTADPATLAFVLQARRWAAWGPDSVAERLALGAEMVELAQTLGDRELYVAGHHTGFVVLQELGEMREAAAEADQQALLADELRSSYYQWHVMVYRAMHATLAGRFADGERLTREALAFGQRADAPNAEQVHTLQRVVLRQRQGRLAEEAAAIRQAASRYPALAIWRCLLASAACELEHADEAGSVLEQLARSGFAGLPRDVFWLSSLALLSETCARLGATGHARTLYELLSPYAALNVMAGRAACLGAVTHFLGLLAATGRDWSVAAGHFEDALSAHERMGAPPLAARTQCEYASMLYAQLTHDSQTMTARDREGRVEHALALLDAARATAGELGMVALTQTVERLRGDLDGHASPPAFPGGLTTREVTVLRLLANGRSNPEIAAELFRSVKTIERHTVNIYAKIGARNRADAAAYAVRHGII